MSKLDKSIVIDCIEREIRGCELLYKQWLNKVNVITAFPLGDKCHFHEWSALDPLVACIKQREFERYLALVQSPDYDEEAFKLRLIKDILGISQWVANKSTNVLDAITKDFRLEALSYVLDLFVRK